MTTAIQLFTNEDFGDIRVVMREGEPWFIAADVCRVLELADVSSSLRKLDDDEKGTHNLPTLGGTQSMLIINESGLYRLVFASRKPEAKKFQRWVFHEVIPSIRKTGSYSVKQAAEMSPLDAVNQVIEIATKIQSFYATRQGIASSQAIALVEPVYGRSLEPLRQLLPPAEHETGYLNPTQIGERLGGIPPQAVNKLLAGKGMEFKVGKDWRLTKLGKEYGEELPYTRNGHSGYQIRWSEKILDVLKS